MARMKDMRRTDADKREMLLAPPVYDPGDYPPGLCLCLDENDLEKLDLDDNVEAGDLIHLFAMAKVTSVHQNDRDGTKSCRVELQIMFLGVEDEDMESADDEDEED